MLLRLKFAPCTSTVIVASSCIDRADAIETGLTLSGRPLPGKLGTMLVVSAELLAPSAPDPPFTPMGLPTATTFDPSKTAPR